MQSESSKNAPSLMSRFARFRIPGAQRLAFGEQLPAVDLGHELDRSIRVSVIIPVFDEADTLPMVLAEVRQLPCQTEIICVLNGCRDTSGQIARQLGAQILDFPEPLGHDVGRAIGVGTDNADVYLFTDADLVIEAADLACFVRAVVNGIDVALNDFSGLLRTDALFHPVNVCKYFLNLALRHGKLGPSSLTAIPHALSRDAMQAIGRDTLASPPLALVKAVLAGLVVEAVHFVDVSTTNRRTPRGLGRDALTNLILGDHLEALEYLNSKLGSRSGFPDNVRRRDLLDKCGGDK